MWGTWTSGPPARFTGCVRLSHAVPRSCCLTCSLCGPILGAREATPCHTERPLLVCHYWSVLRYWPRCLAPPLNQAPRQLSARFQRGIGSWTATLLNIWTTIQTPVSIIEEYRSCDLTTITS